MYILFVLVTGCAAIYDMRTRRIPNRLTLLSTIVFLSWHSLIEHTLGFYDSFYGLLIGLCIGLACSLFGICGGGDMKLLMSIGAALGLSNLVNFLPIALSCLALISSIYLIREKALPLVLMKISSILLLGYKGSTMSNVKVRTTYPVALPLFIGGIAFICIYG